MKMHFKEPTEDSAPTRSRFDGYADTLIIKTHNQVCKCKPHHNLSCFNHGVGDPVARSLFLTNENVLVFFLFKQPFICFILADQIMDLVNLIQLRSHMRKSAPTDPKVLTRMAQCIQQI